MTSAFRAILFIFLNVGFSARADELRIFDNLGLLQLIAAVEGESQISIQLARSDCKQGEILTLTPLEGFKGELKSEIKASQATFGQIPPGSWRISANCKFAIDSVIFVKEE